MIINGHEIKVLAIRRSGHHGIITWIAHHFSSPVVYLNNVKPHSNPYRGKYVKKVVDQLVNKKESHLKLGCFDKLRNPDLHKVEKDCLIYNYEDKDIRALNVNNALFVGNSKKVSNLMVLRDPFNMTASLLKHHSPNGDKFGDKIITNSLKLWTTYAKEYIGETNLVSDKILISFNDWFSKKDYRMEISDQLGLTHNDAGLNYVTPNGNGSSFDGVKFNHKAQQMDVLNRWKIYRRNSKFFDLFSGEVLELANVIFPDVNISVG